MSCNLRKHTIGLPSEDSDQPTLLHSLTTISSGQVSDSQGVKVSLCDNEDRSDCVDAQPDLIFRWAHMSEGTFPDIMAQIIFQSGIYLVQLLDEFCGAIPFIIIGLFMCSALAWVYNIRNFCTDIKHMIGSSVSMWWRVLWVIFTPAIIVVNI